MKRSKYSKHRRNSKPPYAALLIGAGLVMLGLVAALLLSKPEQAASSANVPDEDELSVIPAAVNFAAPELSLYDLQGKQASLSDYEGQVVLVNNWATWCPPCKAEMPTLQSYFEAHQEQGFVLIGIEAGEPATDVAQFVQDYALSFPIWLDPKGEALYAFQNQNLPSSYVIDRDGNVRLAWVGAISKAMLEEYVTPLVEE
jgi:peroxiredoxin